MMIVKDKVNGIWVSNRINGEWAAPRLVLLQKEKELALNGAEFIYANDICLSKRRIYRFALV